MGLKTWLLLLRLISLAQRATAPASSMDMTSGGASAPARVALVLRHVSAKRAARLVHPEESDDDSSSEQDELCDTSAKNVRRAWRNRKKATMTRQANKTSA